MLRFNLQLSWPWSRSATSNTWSVTKPITRNKFFECEVGYWSTIADIFDLSVDLNWRGMDHAGPTISFTLLWFYFTVSVRDMRHWNYKTNQWYKYDSNEIYYEELNDTHRTR